MEADWSVSCGADDPVVIIPWSGKDESLRYIDLQDAPDRVNEIPEAACHASLAAALRSWNQPDAPVFTSKCDVWTYAANSFDAEDLPGFADAQASYIDLVAKDPGVFSSFAASEHLLRNWTERARSIALLAGRCEWTLRPARILTADAGGPDIAEDPSANRENNGFATSLYVWGYGASPTSAADAWSAALLALIEPVRFLQKS